MPFWFSGETFLLTPPLHFYRLYIPVNEHFKQALGLLYLAQRRDTGEKVVIKLIERGASVTRHVASELLLHRNCCGNPLFVQLLDVFLTPTHLAIVMEHVPGGDILDLITEKGPLPEEQARWLFQQLIIGMMYTHAQGACNRDIKLQNKLLTWDHKAEENGTIAVANSNTATANSSAAPAPAVSAAPSAINSASGIVNDILSRISPSVSTATGAASSSAAIATTTNTTAATRNGSRSSVPVADGVAEGTPMERSPSPASHAGAAAVIASPAWSLQGTPARPAVKIQDFMYSKSEQINSDPHSALGSLPYTAPEVLNNSMTQGTAADVWALGVALFKMVTGLYPFQRPEDDGEARAAVQAVLSRIARVDYVIPDSLSPELRDLLARMLVRNPEGRMRLEEILEHPWVKNEMPAALLKMNEAVDPALAPMSEEELRALIAEAQQSLRHLDVENIDDLADEILNEEEADDLLDELSLG